METNGIGLFVTELSEDFILIDHNGSNAGYTASFAFDKKNKNGVLLMRNYFPEYGYRKYTKDFLEQLSKLYE